MKKPILALVLSFHLSIPCIAAPKNSPEISDDTAHALLKIRKENGQRLMNGTGSQDDFSTLLTINDTLGKHKHSYQFFVGFYQQYKQQASDYAPLLKAELDRHSTCQVDQQASNLVQDVCELVTRLTEKGPKQSGSKKLKGKMLVA